MKRILLLLSIAGSSIFANAQILPGIELPGETKKTKDVISPSDPTATREDLPPGLAKKRDGAKSARDYAPGQIKKRNRTSDDNSIFGNGSDNDKKHGKKGKYKKNKVKDRKDDSPLGGIFGQEQSNEKGKDKQKNKDRDFDEDDD